jgi:hypothetical protein
MWCAITEALSRSGSLSFRQPRLPDPRQAGPAPLTAPADKSGTALT